MQRVHYLWLHFNVNMSLSLQLGWIFCHSLYCPLTWTYKFSQVLFFFWNNTWELLAHTFETKTKSSYFFFLTVLLITTSTALALFVSRWHKCLHCVSRSGRASHFLLGLKFLCWIWHFFPEPEITRWLSLGLLSYRSLITLSSSCKCFLIAFPTLSSFSLRSQM